MGRDSRTSYEHVVKKIVFIHGFNDRKKGATTVDRMAPLFKEKYPCAIIDTDSADYGWVGIFVANYLWRFTKIIDRIADTLKDADIVVTHSNGAHFCMRALALINNKGIQVVHYSPAINASWEFKESFKRCFVFHTIKDKPLWYARLMPWSAWGGMGKYGPKTKDKRVFAVNSGQINGHSDWFKRSNKANIFKETYERLSQ